jgi:histone deacetylase complex subunit SAP18
MAAPAKIDRQTTTPFLLRLFFKQNSFHRCALIIVVQTCGANVVLTNGRLDEFDPTLPRLPTNVQIYTWQSCSLRELCTLLLSAVPTLLPQPYAGSRIAFRLVYPDIQGSNRPGAPGRFISRDIGSVIVGARRRDEDTDMEGADEGSVAEALKQLDGDPDKTLADVRFMIGDYVACAILPPLPDGSVPAAPPPLSGPGRGPPSGPYGGRPRENGFGGRGEYGGFGRGGRGGGGRFDDRRLSGGGVPFGEWRRGEAPPDRELGSGRGRGRGGGDDWRDRGRGRGRW